MRTFQRTHMWSLITHTYGQYYCVHLPWYTLGSLNQSVYLKKDTLQSRTNLVCMSLFNYHGLRGMYHVQKNKKKTFCTWILMTFEHQKLKASMMMRCPGFRQCQLVRQTNRTNLVKQFCFKNLARHVIEVKKKYVITGPNEC